MQRHAVTYKGSAALKKAVAPCFAAPCFAAPCFAAPCFTATYFAVAYFIDLLGLSSNLALAMLAAC